MTNSVVPLLATCCSLLFSGPLACGMDLGAAVPLSTHRHAVGKCAQGPLVRGMARHDLIMTSAGDSVSNPNRTPQEIGGCFHRRIRAHGTPATGRITPSESQGHPSLRSVLLRILPMGGCRRASLVAAQKRPATTILARHHRMDWSNPSTSRRWFRQTAACQEVGFDGVFYDNLRLEKTTLARGDEGGARGGGRPVPDLANCGYDVGNYDWLAPWLNGIMYESGWSHRRTEWTTAFARCSRLRRCSDAA